MGFSEIDKYAIKSYCAVHNVSETKNYGDIKNIDASKLPDFDLLTWGFPCQDISIAGKMKGIKEGETRSGLYYEGYRILKEKRPKYSIIENVKNLTSKRFKTQFDSILKDLSDLGYTNYWKVLNAKDYCIPQNRERVFIISIRNDIDNKSFNFPKEKPLLLKLKDLLEANVEEKYYLSEKGIGRLIRKNNKLIREEDNPKFSSCIIANYYKMSGGGNQYISKREEKNSPVVLINDGSKRGYIEATEGDSINISYINNIKKRGRVGKAISQTIVTIPGIAVLEKSDKKHTKASIQNRVYDEDGIYPTVLASNFRPKISQKGLCDSIKSRESDKHINCNIAMLLSNDGKEYLKIRKLTPLECWRLMGFDDSDFYNAKNIGISDTQLYKQAGNSIVVNVLEYLFIELFHIKI